MGSADLLGISLRNLRNLAVTKLHGDVSSNMCGTASQPSTMCCPPDLQDYSESCLEAVLHIHTCMLQDGDYPVRFQTGL